VVGKAPERFVVYALGGGHGHAVRGALIAADLERRGVACRLLVRSECGPIARALAPTAIIRSIGETEPPELQRIVREAIDAHEATDMLVDTFPEGLLGELNTRIAVRRWAVLRLRRDALSPSFLRALEHYHAVADVEPDLDWLPHVRVARLTPLSRRIEVGGEGVALIDADGLDAFLSRLAQRLSHHVPVVRVKEWIHRVPPVVIGPSGYNLTYELARAGAFHLALPRPRAFDDQRRRAAAVAELVESPEALERRALTLARQPEVRARTGEGAERVADWLLADERQVHHR